MQVFGSDISSCSIKNPPYKKTSEPVPTPVPPGEEIGMHCNWKQSPVVRVLQKHLY